MQVDLNCNCPKPNPNFGMAIHSNKNVNNVIQSRIKTEQLCNQLNKLVTKANQNSKIDICLFERDGKLSANIFAKDVNSNFLTKQKSESSLEKLIFGSLHFLKRVVNTADKAAKKIESTDFNCDGIFAKMK